MIIIHAVFHVNPERKEQFLAETKPLIAGSKAEKGCLSYDLCQHTEDNNTFMMIEAWKDQDAVTSHNASSHFTQFASKAGTFLTAPLDIKVFKADPVNA